MEERMMSSASPFRKRSSRSIAGGVVSLTERVTWKEYTPNIQSRHPEGFSLMTSYHHIHTHKETWTKQHELNIEDRSTHALETVRFPLSLLSASSFFHAMNASAASLSLLLACVDTQKKRIAPPEIYVHKGISYKIKFV